VGRHLDQNLYRQAMRAHVIPVTMDEVHQMLELFREVRRGIEAPKSGGIARIRVFGRNRNPGTQEWWWLRTCMLKSCAHIQWAILNESRRRRHLLLLVQNQSVSGNPVHETADTAEQEKEILTIREVILYVGGSAKSSRKEWLGFDAYQLKELMDRLKGDLPRATLPNGTHIDEETGDLYLRLVQAGITDNWEYYEKGGIQRGEREDRMGFLWWAADGHTMKN